MTSKSIFMSGAAMLTLSIAMPAMAQDREGTLVDPLVITVERRAESLQDVPIAVTAVDSSNRDELGIMTIQDMAQFAPGVSYNTATDRPTIRGIGRQSNSFSLDSPVANYFDGAYTSSVQDASRRPIFIERTEILRGPQGALSGRGSIAGAVNTISKRPADSFEAEIGGLAGNYGLYGLEGTVSAPLLPWLRYRANVGHYRQEKGYFRNVAFPSSEGDQPNNRNIYDLLLEGDIGDNLSFFLKGAWANYDETYRSSAFLAPYATGNSFCSPSPYSGGGGLVPNAAYGYFSAVPAGCPTAGTPTNNGAVVLGGVTSNPVTEGDLGVFNADFTSRQQLDDHHQYVADVTWASDGFDLRYIGSHNNYLYIQHTDADGTPVQQMSLPSQFGAGRRVVDPSGINLYQEEREWFSHELTLASTNDGPLQWIAGLYQSDEDYDQQPSSQVYRGYAELNTPGAAAATDPVVPATNAVPFRAQYGQLIGETISTAAFGQIDYQRNDAWKFTFGLRYNKDEKEVVEQTRLIYNNLSSLAGGFFNGLFPGAVDITYGQAPGYSTFVPGVGIVPPGSTVIDPVAEGFPIVGTNHVLPNGGGNVPVGQQILLAPGVVGLPTTDAAGNRVRELAGEWSAITGSLGVNFTPDDDSLYYFRFARGYRPGGFNAGFITGTPQVEEETVDSYEIGAKLTLWDRLQLNTAAFLYDYQDIQLPLAAFERCTVPGDFSSCTAVNSFVNLPTAENKGVEIEGVWYPNDNLRITLSYSYLDARINDGLTTTGFENPQDPGALLPTAQPFLPINCAAASASCQLRTVDGTTGLFSIDTLTQAVRFTQDLSGNRLVNAPRHKLFANASYTFFLPAGDLILSGTYVWRDAAQTDLFGSTINQTQEYGLANLRAIWRDGEDRYQLIAYVNNVFDETVSEFGFATRRSAADPLSPGAISAASATYYPGYNLSTPRTFGVEARRRF